VRKTDPEDQLRELNHSKMPMGPSVLPVGAHKLVGMSLECLPKFLQALVEITLADKETILICKISIINILILELSRMVRMFLQGWLIINNVLH
jgi:hypothetical protein